MKAPSIIVMYMFSLLILTDDSLRQPVTQSSERPEKCYIIAVEGGGTKGAYMAGVIEAFAKNLPPDERKWTVLGGVSAGSVTMAPLLIYPIGQEIEAAEFTTKVWKGIKKSDIY